MRAAARRLSAPASLRVTFSLHSPDCARLRSLRETPARLASCSSLSFSPRWPFPRMSLKLSSKGMVAMNDRRLSFASVREQENSRHAVADASEFLTADGLTRHVGEQRSALCKNQHSAPSTRVRPK